MPNPTQHKIPKHWKIIELGKVTKISMGQSPPSSTYNTNRIGLPFFQGKAEFTDLHPIPTKWCNSPKKIAYKNDLLISVRAPVGDLNIADQECCIGRGLAALNFQGEQNYLYYFIKSIKQKLDALGTGTTFKAISGKVLKEFPLPLPPIDEQKAIVAKIEELFTAIDKGVEELKTAQEKLKQYRQSVLKSAFDKIETREIREEKLKNITSKIGSGSTPKGGKSSYHSSGIPLVRSMNIHFDFIKYKDLAFIDEIQASKLNNVIIKTGDVLLNITGASIGRVNIAPKDFNNGRVNQHVSIIRSKPEVFYSEYLKYYLQSPKIQDWITAENYGATRQALTKTMIENLELPLPSKKEQTQIVAEIEKHFTATEKMEQSISDSLQKATQLKQSILKKAFEGRLV